MITRRVVVATGVAAVVAAGGAAAVAATTKDERKATEAAILSDAAKDLEVSPSELKKALGDAQDAQIDQAVKDGKITKEQGEAMKARRAQNGTVLGMPHRGGPGGRGHGHHRGGRGGLFGASESAAKALGLTETELRTQLRSGKTLNEIAKAEGKDIADVKKAVRSALSEKLATAVKDGKTTDAQRDEALERFDEHFDDFADGKRPMGRRGHGGPRPGAESDDPDAKPGSYPGEVAPSGQAA